MTTVNVHRPDRQPSRALGPTTRLAIHADACIPARFPEMSCRRCADACPTGALVATSEGPELASGCVDCGRCVVACPTEALSVPGFEITPTTSGMIAMDCWRVPAKDSPSGAVRVPCLGGLSTTRLAELTAEADERPVALLDRGFCARCPAGVREHPDTHPAALVIDEVRRLLDDCGVAPTDGPRLIAMPLPAARMVEGIGEPLLESRISRRALFTGQALRTSQPAPAPRATPPAQTAGLGRQRLLAALQRLSAAERPLPARLFPSLTANHNCADHRVCASACPTGALTAYTEDAARGLRFDAAACIACDLCTRLCPEQALTLDGSDETTTERTPQRLTRHATQTCPECGAEHSNPEPVCPACRRDRDFARSAFLAFSRRPPASSLQPDAGEAES
ncbi:4Fe-4S binding protein [Thiocapsa rosea]|uniref:4Fe-4S binding protein n=1 Tax=Thiocapsa rosea TaxID=69360 RepID=A0A495VDW5_9GAMM|nr:4Fe-4S dicluster domain-containing protein [Thiocapsa rosea]RKT46990.1 4Fe-4S binding protein [Thiocapsa rosea]